MFFALLMNFNLVKIYDKTRFDPSPLTTWCYGIGINQLWRVWN